MMVDTDVVIWYMRDHTEAVALLDGNQGFSISVITYMELVQRMKNKREFKALHTALNMWKAKIIQVDETISTKAMFHVEQYCLRHSMRMADALIGATAILKRHSLHTGNLKHFSIFKELDLQPFHP